MRTNTAATARNVTHEGTPARELSPEQELRRTLLACLLWEDAFYEKGSAIAARLEGLILAVRPAVAAALAIEARTKQKLRHVPLFVACTLAGGSPAQRAVVSGLLFSIIQRADELTEFLAIYWRNGRRPLSAQVKRGLARAFRKFSGEQLAKYDRSDAVKLRDVMFLTHPRPADAAQATAWKQLAARTLPAPDTWEVALSAGADRRATWERLIGEQKLGALALLRNLRNMQQACVSDSMIRGALDTMQVDRVLPFRFIAAARHAPHLEDAIERAMFRCLASVPPLLGRTALVIDTSPSMWGVAVSRRSDMDRFDAAAALAILCREVCDTIKVYAFNERAYTVPARHGFALRDALAQTKGSASCGGLAVAEANADGYDRIIVLTDGQWHYSSTGQYPAPPGGFPPGEAVRRDPFAHLDRVGHAAVVSPAPLTAAAYMVNVGTDRCGVGYGKWTQIDGWSEHVLTFLRSMEEQPSLG